MGNKEKNGLLIFLLVFLLLPLLQKNLPFVDYGGLNGNFKAANDSEFTLRQWFNRSYWDNESQYINDNMGFRPDLIRLNNQIDYSLFDKIHSAWKLMGENSCIFQDTYIYAYLGQDFQGYSYLLEKVRKLKAIQDTLAKVGKSLILVDAPSKASYYPENFPSEFKDVQRGATNAATYNRICDSLGLNLVDLDTWLVSLKNKSTELLYPKQGFHWSEYAALLGADTLTRYIEKLRNIKMIHARWTKIVHTSKPRLNDNDIARSMNLMFPLANELFSYPDVTYPQDKSAVKPKTIYVGDSFLFQWIDDGIMDHTNSNWQIWYYNMNVINNEFNRQTDHMLQDDFRFEQIDNADCIVIMFTAPNLRDLGRGFIEQTYDHFYPGK